MASRDGIVTRVDLPCDGGVSPNRKIPRVTVEVRCFWPDAAERTELLYALADAYNQAREEALAKFDQGPHHQRVWLHPPEGVEA